MVINGTLCELPHLVCSIERNSRQISTADPYEPERVSSRFFPPFLIHPVEDGDQPGVLAVYRQCQDFLALGPNPIATEELVRQDIEHSRREGGQYCVIVDSKGQTIGVIDYRPNHFEGHPEHAFIELLMIAAPYRRLGLVQQVLNQIEAEFKINDKIRSILTAVQVNNQLALRFWQKHGYRIVGGPEMQPDTTITYRLQKSL